MQSREPLQRQDSNNDESQDSVPTVLETTNQTTPSDPIKCLAEVVHPDCTLIVRPVSTTTLTFHGKSEKFQLFKDHFHTMISHVKIKDKCLDKVQKTPIQANKIATVVLSNLMLLL